MTRGTIVALVLAMGGLVWAAPALALSRLEIACAGSAGATIEQRIAACTRIIRRAGRTPHERAVAFNNRGGALYYSGKPERAIEDYDQAIKLDPHFAHAFNNRCWSGAVLGRTEQAAADCTKVIKLYNIANTFENRGFIYLKRGEFDLAIADYEAGLRLDPPNKADFLYGRGLAKTKKGDASGAADIAAAKVIKPTIAEDFAKYGLK
jgi:tetratricopeptide (TPR) repeat protein